MSLGSGEEARKPWRVTHIVTGALVRLHTARSLRREHGDPAVFRDCSQCSLRKARPGDEGQGFGAGALAPRSPSAL